MADVCFFKNGSSYISAANIEVSTRFGLLIDFDLLKAVTSTNTKPEVVLAAAAAISINEIDVIVGTPIWTNFSSPKQNDMQPTENGRDRTQR